MAKACEDSYALSHSTSSPSSYKTRALLLALLIHLVRISSSAASGDSDGASDGGRACEAEAAALRLRVAELERRLAVALAAAAAPVGGVGVGIGVGGFRGHFRERYAAASTAAAATAAGASFSNLLLLLADPPLASKDAALKQANFELIMGALQACAAKEAQMTLFLETLCDADAADYLMKVVYRGLRTPDSSALLLRLHAQLLEKAGMGCIVRAIVDRQTA